MQEPTSPILSCKKYGKNTHVLPESPILSCGRKRKRSLLPDDSPVFLRTVKNCKGKESPVIDSFSSPPAASNNTPSSISMKLKPKSLFTNDDIDDAPHSVESQLSHSSSQKCNIIDEEDSHSDASEDDFIIHERTLSDSEDKLNLTASHLYQTSSYYSGISTPEKKVVKAKPIATGSARKKKQFKPNGLAKQLSKLLVRQESDYHLWKFQQKLCSSMSKTVKTLRLKIESLSPGNVHSFAHCRNLVASSSSKGEGSLSINKNNRVSLVFTPERWERFNNVQSGDIVSIYEPWQSMELVGGVTLLLDFNLCKKVHHQKKKEEVVSKLSNVSDDGRRNDIKTLEDLTDAADGRACSSASADSIAAAQVAQNRRPSTVTVLQTWTYWDGRIRRGSIARDERVDDFFGTRGSINCRRSSDDEFMAI
uniref:DUF4502 domain-containing protein n=1 Tax=Daphnia galeata TaxID=27404 RepID=A0A8J2RI86_9CRUS|nr:unnamed protein product [Daphnia galeata]